MCLFQGLVSHGRGVSCWARLLRMESPQSWETKQKWLWSRVTKGQKGRRGVRHPGTTPTGLEMVLQALVLALVPLGHFPGGCCPWKPPARAVLELGGTCGPGSGAQAGLAASGVPGALRWALASALGITHLRSKISHDMKAGRKKKKRKRETLFTLIKNNLRQCIFFQSKQSRSPSLLIWEAERELKKNPDL